MSAFLTANARRPNRECNDVAAAERAARTAYHLRIASRIAKRLAWQHGIPPFESTLVPWFTRAPCTSNIDALTDWVRTQLADQSVFAFDTGAKLMADSSHCRTRLLASIEDSHPW